jgi:hypothetical protein
VHVPTVGAGDYWSVAKVNQSKTRSAAVPRDASGDPNVPERRRTAAKSERTLSRNAAPTPTTELRQGLSTNETCESMAPVPDARKLIVSNNEGLGKEERGVRTHLERFQWGKTCRIG